MLRNFPISLRLYVLGFVAFGIILSMLLSAQYLQFKHDKLFEVNSDISKIKELILLERRHEKDFMARKDLKYLKKFEEKMLILKEQMHTLKSNLSSFGYTDTTMDKAVEAMSRYGKHFHELVAIEQMIGLDHTQGLRGTLRTSVHNAEKLIKTFHNDLLLVDMLTLRRNEKDFFIRELEKYP